MQQARRWAYECPVVLATIIHKIVPKQPSRMTLINPLNSIYVATNTDVTLKLQFCKMEQGTTIAQYFFEILLTNDFFLPEEYLFYLECMTPLHYFTLLKLKVILLLSRMPILLYLFHRQALECITGDSASNKYCQPALWCFSFLKQVVIVPFLGSSKAFNTRLGGSVTLHCNPPPQHASPPPAWISAAAFPNPQQHRPQQLPSFEEKKESTHCKYRAV